MTPSVLLFTLAILAFVVQFFAKPSSHFALGFGWGMITAGWITFLT